MVIGFIDIAKECFASIDELVINWKGENYYKACGEAMFIEDGVTSHCIKRVGHPSIHHESYDGRLTMRT